jgi:mannose-6-phosphate isomerase
MSIELLKPVIQKYHWGHTSYLQRLLGDEDSIGEPWAELWLGSHPNGMSRVLQHGDGSVALDQYLRDHHAVSVGKYSWDVSDQGLPFLFKVLAVASPLSIQCHPTREQARMGFDREETAAVAPDDPGRSYHDPNHKPEIICAVTDFTALAGFRKIEQIIDLFTRYVPEVYQLLFGSFFEQQDIEEASAYRYLLESILTISGKKRTVCMQLLHESMASFNDTDSQEIALTRKLLERYPDDLSVLAPLYLEMITLEPGEALYLPAGVLHAYIEGIGVELMAASDNVLRGGLTEKNIDVAELLKVVRFNYNHRHKTHRVREGSGRFTYHTPAQDFELHAMEHGSCTVDERRFLELVIQVSGRSRFTYRQGTSCEDAEFTLEHGQTCLIPADVCSYTMECDGKAFIAGIPDESSPL